MRYDRGKWTFWKFSNAAKWSPNSHNVPKWIPERNEETQKYMLNAYRVLLTRARQGLIICVPEGNARQTPDGFPEDATRLPSFYTPTYDYFKSLGLQEI